MIKQYTDTNSLETSGNSEFHSATYDTITNLQQKLLESLMLKHLISSFLTKANTKHQNALRKGFHFMPLESKANLKKRQPRKAYHANCNILSYYLIGVFLQT